ncbi:MAG TPA: hypothetical protein VGH88_23985 [Streptosporangiaceae bacterium]|jgi:hypothetical protein
MTGSWDDDELIAALGHALAAREAVPRDFVEAGQRAFAWRNIDAELAQLTYDSARGTAPEPALRSAPEAASIRALTFTSAHLTIELEITGDALVGQVVPVQAGTIEVQRRSGPATTFAADEIGCFTIAPIPASPFRLYCRTAAGIDAITGWVTL